MRLHIASCNIKRPIYIHPLTIAYLLPTALTLAQKYLDDMGTYNIHMADTARIPLPIMNRLEREMLFTMQGNLYVSPSYYQTIIRGVFSEYNSQASSFKIFPKSSLPPDRRLTDSDIATFSHYFEILYPSGNCLQSKSNFLSIFHCATKPSYTVQDYIEHLNYYCRLTLYKMLLATNYIYHLHSNTFNTKNPIYIHEFTVHRLLLAALVLVLRQHYQNISPEILNRALTRISCVTEDEIQELSGEMEIYCNYAQTTLSDYESIHEQVFSETIQHTIFKMPDSNPSCTDSIAPNENEADYNSEPGLVKLDFP